MLDLVKETDCSYTYFMNLLAEKVRIRMGEEFSVRIIKVTKNNSLELDSLVILKKGRNFAPNIYLLPYYEAYIQGASVQALAESLCETYKNHSVPLVKDNFLYTFDEMSPFIIYRLVSYDRNKKLLENIPHRKYLDMAVTYHCLVRDDTDGIGTIRISNEHIKKWETSLQELHNLAIVNTKNIFPSIIKSMEEAIYGMFEEEYGNSITDEGSSKIQNRSLDKDLLHSRESKDHNMYILTNQKGINGATCLLYENVLKEFSNQIHSDFFILPSSIHEVIIVPYDKTISKEALSDMVREVNLTQVARDEVLSNRVYFYSRKSNTISM